MELEKTVEITLQILVPISLAWISANVVGYYCKEKTTQGETDDERQL